ncbi:hypothetical protein V6N13_139956 [Hibiscus sabdariffa]|uniref:Uncharacterized protein n=2 Tax=Hibiscus sabdariffa TaxID=183260 RepID=A0ABR1ZN31_9ROSI
MAFYEDEEEAWKCSRHPSRRRRTGICPVCLRDKLASLCPDCAHARPCECIATSSSSSSSSSSFSRFSTAASRNVSGVGAVGRMSNLIESEPAFRRSRSLAVPFLRSKPQNLSERNDPAGSKSRTPSFWSIFRAGNKSRRYEGEDHENQGGKEKRAGEEERRRMMMRKSRSVAGIGEMKSSPSPSPSTKGKGWYFPSPMKVLRVSKLVFQEGSPLHRG